MAKVALLIGVSEYGEGLPSLPGTQDDLQKMQRVLKNSQVGGFDAVDLLENPDPTQMQLAIETLFSENRTRDDLVLLYFSGHGYKDDNGNLYFCTRISQKMSQGRVRIATTVPASALQRYMGLSRSKRQVLILDCCFSGAFANDMKAKGGDEAIAIKAQLGSEGRAVLTSSTATQVSYERDGSSIYTRYLVQGLETGAADRNDDGQITVDELHEYAREKVQEVAPTMRPEIYAAQEGYKILIARAPQGDPKLGFRKEVNERAKQKRGKLSRIDLRSLNLLAQQSGIPTSEAQQILQEVLQPFQAFWKKINEFEQAVQEALEDDPEFGASSRDDLKYLQRILQLPNEDIAPILADREIALTPPPPSSPPKRTKTVPNVSAIPDIPPAPPMLQDNLASERNVGYTKLRDLLKSGKWKEADQETETVMLQAVGKKASDYLTREDLQGFPCVDLKTIDRLWVQYSNGKWGFSVQKRIWEECGRPMSYNADWERFGDRVGWRKDGDWLSYSGLTFNLDTSPVGEFPRWVFGRRGGGLVGIDLVLVGGTVGSLLSRSDL